MLAVPHALAIGFARAPSNVALGSPLNFPIGVQLGTDESLIANCVGAEVYQGEQRVAPSNVRVAIEPGSNPDERVVRVTTSVAIEEPLVSIHATLGCVNRIERRFTVFADPPLVTYAEAPTPPAAPQPTTSAAPVTAAAPASAPEPAAAAPAPAAEPATALAPAPAAVRARAAAPAPAAASAPRRVARPAAPRPAASAPLARPRTAVAAAPRGSAPVIAKAPAASAPTSRLKLDALEPAAAKAAAAASAAQQDAALRVAAAAASAALAAQAASTAQANADAAAERLKAMEQALEAVKAEAQRNRDQMAQMRARISDADSARRYLPWLFGALAVLLGMVAWLWFRLRRTQREQQAQWSAAAAAAKAPPTNPPTLQPMTLPPHLAPTPAARPMPPAGRPAAPTAPAGPQPFGAPSTLFPDSVMTNNAPTRDVSIEELIDLEQQAEFFIVLGQDEAAIDLLMGHIRSSGGTSALPYLKLLEIYRRQGDRENYERTRTRFNHRFNAYAPDWESDLQLGRSLVDYPKVVERLQRLWVNPIDAMTELESLVFRRDAGELFELPAYREVLFLYSMARDLAEHQGGSQSPIDVLLPLVEEGGTFEATTATPHLITPSTLSALSEFGRHTEAPIEVLSATKEPPRAFSVTDHGTPIDLDLTGPVPMDEPPCEGPEERSDFMNLPPAPPRRR
ncbi:MAG: hypothetical protein U1E89_21065 [Burkholderiaceae bacterium]